MIFNYKKIKDLNQPYIIAEVGVNHNCSLKLAKKMIKENLLFRENIDQKLF